MLVLEDFFPFSNISHVVTSFASMHSMIRKEAMLNVPGTTQRCRTSPFRKKRGAVISKQQVNLFLRRYLMQKYRSRLSLVPTEGEDDVYTASEQFATAFESLASDLSIPKQLRQVGVSVDDGGKHVDLLATEAMKQTRLLPNNPRAVTLEDAHGLYNKAL